jgi:hypothetical protein
VTRCLEIISEASRRLPEAMKARHPSIAWSDMAGAGNVYRHDYDDVAAWHVCTHLHSIYHHCGWLSSKNFVDLGRAPNPRLASGLDRRHELRDHAHPWVEPSV